jgi:hypothetical protein
MDNFWRIAQRRHRWERIHHALPINNTKENCINSLRIFTADPNYDPENNMARNVLNLQLGGQRQHHGINAGQLNNNILEYVSFSVTRPDAANQQTPFILSDEDVYENVLDCITFILIEKIRRIQRANRIWVDFFLMGETVIQHDAHGNPVWQPTGRIIRRKLTRDQLQITAGSNYANIMNVITNGLTEVQQDGDPGSQYENEIIIRNITLYMRPVPLTFGCGNGGTKVLNDYLCFFPDTRNKKKMNICFLACIKKQFNLQCGVKGLVQYYPNNKYRITKAGTMPLTQNNINKKFKIPFPITLENIEAISEIFRWNIHIMVKIEDEMLEYKYMNGEENEIEMMREVVKIMAYEENGMYHMGLILKKNPQLFCEVCQENHSLSKSKVSCMMTNRKNMFQKLRVVDGVNPTKLINRLRLNSIKEYSKGQYFVHSDFGRRRNTQEKMSVNTVQAFDGSIFWDLEAYDTGTRKDFDFLEGQKAYAVGAAFSSFNSGTEDHNLNIYKYRDFYGKNCIEEFVKSLEEYTKEVALFYKSSLKQNAKTKNKIYLNLISFNGAGYDNHFLLNVLLDELQKDVTNIDVIPNSIVNSNGRIIGLKFCFKKLDINQTMRRKNPLFYTHLKNPQYKPIFTRNNSLTVKHLVHRQTGEIIHKLINSFEDMGSNFIISCWDLAQFLQGSLASCGKSFGVSTENLKTVFPHRLIRSSDIQSTGLTEVTWHHFNPEDFNDKKKANEIEKIYKLDPNNPNSSSKVEIFPLIKDYLRKDVYTLKEIFSRFAYEIHDNFSGFNVTTVITGSQLTYKLWLIDAHIKAESTILHSKAMLETLPDHARNLEIDRIRADFIPTLVPSADDYDFIKSSYTGGRTYPKERNFKSQYLDFILKNCKGEKQQIFKYKDNFEHALTEEYNHLKYDWSKSDFTFDDIQDDIIYGDVNSLYPTVMSYSIDMPTGFYMGPLPIEKIREVETQFKKEGVDCQLAGVFHCLVDSKGYVEHPLIRTKLKNGQNLWTYGKQETVITNQTLKYLIYAGYDVSILGGVLWDKSGNYLKDYIQHIYKLRVEAKKEGKTAKSNTLKLLMNSLYGKFAQRIMTSLVALLRSGQDFESFNFDMQLDAFFIKNENLHILIGKNEYHEIDAEVFMKKEKPIVLASCITAGSRILMQEYFDLIKGILYTDTDSLFARRKRLEEIFGVDFTKSYDSKFFPGLKLQFHSSELGALKNELDKDQKIIGAVFAGAKFYGYLYINREGDIGYEMKIKGIPQNQLRQQDLFDIFNDPTEEKEVSFFQMKKAGIIPVTGMESLTINRNISSRTVNKTQYSSMKLNEETNKFESYSYQELTDVNDAFETVIEDTVEYTSQTKKNKMYPKDVEAREHLNDMVTNSSFFPDDLEISTRQTNQVNFDPVLATSSMNFEQFCDENALAFDLLDEEESNAEEQVDVDLEEMEEFCKYLEQNYNY